MTLNAKNHIHESAEASSPPREGEVFVTCRLHVGGKIAAKVTAAKAAATAAHIDRVMMR